MGLIHLITKLKTLYKNRYKVFKRFFNSRGYVLFTQDEYKKRLKKAEFLGFTRGVCSQEDSGVNQGI